MLGGIRNKQVYPLSHSCIVHKHTSTNEIKVIKRLVPLEKVLSQDLNEKHF